MNDRDHPHWLTAEWLGEVLGHPVRSLTSRRIGDGLVGMNLRLSIEYTDPVDDLPTIGRREAALARPHQQGHRHGDAQLRA